MEKKKRILSIILTVCMVVGGLNVPSKVEAAVYQNTTNINLVNEADGSQVTGNKSGSGWYWNNSEKVLTLEDGFELNIDNTLKQAALSLKADTTILLKGTAKISTNHKAIEALGSLNIKSQDGTKGYLKIFVSQKGSNGYFNYGIEIRNPEGASNRKLTVTDNTILDISGGDKSIMCSAGYLDDNNNDVASNNKALLEITNQSAVQLRHETAIAAGFQIKNAERILWLNGNETPKFLQEQEVRSLDSQKNLTMMSIKLEGVADNDKKNYDLTYDGTEHPILVNKNVTVLQSLGIGKIQITPENFFYYETRHSEFLNDENSDFRDKEVVKTMTQYEAFTADSASPKNAAKYRLYYNNNNFVTLNINQREVTVTGLTVKDKTYDGWEDAEIDYTDMAIRCINDNNNGITNTNGIVDGDAAKVGHEIVPYAKAYFVEEIGGGASYVNPFGDGKNYQKSADVAYTGTGTSAQKKVTSKVVVIDNGTDDSGITTGISLSDPNYRIVTPSAETNATSQIRSEGTIYPRALTDTNITCTLTPNLVKWRPQGYSEETDIIKSVKDISPITPNQPGLVKTLVADRDFIVNPNTNTITEVAEYEIILTGQGNYTGTKRLNWSIDRAQRQINIKKTENRAYNGNAYTITAKANSSDFWYEVKDTDNNTDVTETLEEGSNLKITYKGTKADGSTYPESLTAPTDAGNYTVMISVDQTARYTAASAQMNYTILPKTVDLVWNCTGGTVEETEQNPSSLTYNGTKNIFSATVSNTVEGDTVKVTNIVYDGNTTGGKNYNASATAPFEAGSYTVRATELDNKNYTLTGTLAHSAATPGHAYVVNKAPLWLTWEEDNTEFTYDATDHTPVSEIHGLCENEEGVEDTCKVTTWSFTGTDVFGNAYTQAGTKAVNASNGTVKITATGISNPNYKLVQGEGSLSSNFTIIPRDLSALEVGTADDHKEIWAEKLYYSGKVVEPTIVWSLNEIGETLTKDVDYTASLSTKSLEYNKNGLNIKIVGKGNYVGETIIPWNVDKLMCPITVVNASDYSNIVYGDALPEFEVAYVNMAMQNEDIVKNYADSMENHLSYLYTGTMKNGETYESEFAPTQVGTYEITVTLEETDHYQKEITKIPLVIKQKPVTVTGIVAVEKEYDGSDSAVLDFSHSVWNGIVPSDSATISAALANVADPTNGFISYTATFEGKDVVRNSDYARTIKEQNVTISNCAIAYADATSDIFYNYVIETSGNQDTAKAKIVPKEVVISGIKAKDKVYNGSKEAELDLKDMQIIGVATGELLEVKVRGEFTKTSSEASEKDVRMDAGQPAAKTVKIVYERLISGNSSTNLENYTINTEKEGVQKTTTAIISPATLTIKGVKAKDKVYDSREDVQIDWSNATIEGVFSGDVVTLSDANATDWPLDRYADANVVYDKSGNVIEKTGTITAGKYQVKLEGLYQADDYVVDTVIFSGKINPKPLKGITWTFSSTLYNQLPTAVFDDDCGIIGEEAFEPVVKFYQKDNPDKEITQPYMVDNGEYVAKVVDVKLSSDDSNAKTNYCVDETDPDQSFTFKYESNQDESNLEILNYQRTGNTAYTIVYGNKLPEPELKYNNSDIDKEDPETRASHFTYHYTGKSLSGKSYDSDKAPTAAGAYKISITLEETAHFKGSKASANFIIAPAEVRIVQGINVLSKKYNGTNKATLDFKNIVFDGVTDEDEETITALFEADELDMIRYSATYAQKDVLWLARKMTDDGKIDNSLAEIDVTAGNYSFILNEDTPDVLYNYTIAASGNITQLKGKIEPRPVTVSGIKVIDKVYDGTAIANLDLSEVTFDGKIKGDVLGIKVTGNYVVTNKEATAKDVLYDNNKNIIDKKVVLDIEAIIAGDENTNAENYILAESGQQEDAQAKILPIVLNKVEWSFDEKTQLPSATFTRKNGIIEADVERNSAEISIYSKDDTAFAKAVSKENMAPGDIYVARVEGYTSTNYIISNKFENPVFTFAFGTKNTATPEQKAVGAIALNAGLSLKWKKGNLTFKWGKVDGADGYLVYTREGNKKYGKGVKVKGKTSYTIKAKSKKKIYKAYVKAYKIVKGKKVVIGKSLKLSCAGSGIQGYNPSKLKVAKKSITVVVKNTAAIKATVTVKKGKKAIKKKGKAASLRYWSTDSSVAAVATNGTIMGMKTGTCYVYVIARNGLKKKIKVTVKDL